MAQWQGKKMKDLERDGRAELPRRLGGNGTDADYAESPVAYASLGEIKPFLGVSRIVRCVVLSCFVLVPLAINAGNSKSEVMQGIPLDKLDEICNFEVKNGEEVRQAIDSLPVVMHLDRDLPKIITNLAIDAMEIWNYSWRSILWQEYGGNPFGDGVDEGILDLELFTWEISSRKLERKEDGINAILMSDDNALLSNADTTPIQRRRAKRHISKYDIHYPIIDADIRIFFHQRKQTKYNYNHKRHPRYNEVDVLTILVHELGHVLGLKHWTSSKKSVMEEIISRGERILPAKVDIDNLLCGYGFAMHWRYSDSRNRNSSHSGSGGGGGGGLRRMGIVP